MPISFGTEREYEDALIQLVQVSESYLSSLKNMGVMPLSISGKGELAELIGLVSVAEMSQVANLSAPLASLQSEITTLASKLGVVRDAYKQDPALKNFFGTYAASPVNVYQKLNAFITTALNQVNACIAAQAAVSKHARPAKNWIETIKVQQASDATYAKATRSDAILGKVNILISKVGVITNQTRTAILHVQSTAGKEEITD